MFDSKSSLINCPYDNIVVYDENKHKILDYCERKKAKSFVGVKHVSNALYVLYIYESGFMLSASFDWLAFDVINVSNPFPSPSESSQTENTLETTSIMNNYSSVLMISTTAPKTTTLPKTSKQLTNFTQFYPTNTIEPVYEIINQKVTPPITTTVEISNQSVITANTTNIISTTSFSTESIELNTTDTTTITTSTITTTTTTKATINNTSSSESKNK
jgi:hypothetical protein